MSRSMSTRAAFVSLIFCAAAGRAWAAPSLSSVAPSNGPTAGGTPITISGTGFELGQATTTVGGNNCSPVAQTAGRVVCILPAGEGANQPVQVQVSGEFSNTLPFSYNPPSVTSVTPSFAPSIGGTVITIRGDNFGVGSAWVSIESSSCLGVTTLGPTKITCTLTPGSGRSLPLTVFVAGQFSNSVPFDFSEPCAAGFFSPNGQDLPQACSPCLPGTFAPNAGSASCHPCPLGRYADQLGSAVCSLCSEGFFADVPGSIACSPCAPGTFANMPETEVCSACPGNHYQPNSASVECLPCGCADADACTVNTCNPVTAACLFETPDRDGDTRTDPCDNCVMVPNTNQADVDRDQVGDVCDNCPVDSNPSQADFNYDGEGDRCDLNDGRIVQYRVVRDRVDWQAEAGDLSWNLYFGDLAVLRSTSIYTQVPGSNPLADRICGLQAASGPDAVSLAPGKLRFSLVAGVSSAGEGSLGDESSGIPRANTSPCP